MEDDFKKQLLGVGTEIGGGIATDVATTPLLGFGPAGVAAYVATNFGQGAYTNYLVQKHLYGNENINWGEVLGSGVAGAIPFMNIPASKGVAKVVGKAGSIKRGFTGGLTTGLVSEQTRIGIDENRLLSFDEMAIAAGVGGIFGGGFTAAGKKLQKVQANRAYKKYYGNYGSPGEAARAKHNANLDLTSKLYSEISVDDYDDLPIDPKIGQRITGWKAYASGDEKTELAVNGWMARMRMPKNADGEYVYDHNQYLKAAEEGLIRKGSDDRIFIGTFVAAAKVKAGKAYEKELRSQFMARYKTLFDVLGIPDSHFQPHHLLPLKASLPLYHGLVYGSEEWWKLTAHLLKRNIQAGDSMDNIKMLIGAGQKTMPRLTRTGKKNPVPGAKTVKTPHSIQHAYIRDPDNGIGEAGQYFFTPDVLTSLKNEPLQRIPITDKFLKKMRRGFELTNDAETIYNSLFDMRNLDQDELKLNIEQLTAVLNKLDNDGYLPKHLQIKEDWQTDLLPKIIKTIEKQGDDKGYRRMVDFERIQEGINKLGDDIDAFGLKLKRFDQNLSVDDYQNYMTKVLKRNAKKFSLVTDLDDAAEMAEIALRPIFIEPNGQMRAYPIKMKKGSEGLLTYELAVDIMSKIILKVL